ncbi:amidohydrolase [Flammeovirga kamogawensis]|uniref:Amidohydrolase n=1 Tax=Flammeovirga kamogawensis TaxID=373891 RepID=A0ABX8GQE1_9BACT|nr:amidohydrolase [Flammeovirga kamogawensis]MBB6463037.1 hypothetical protein [Flammeovirga kamogawensis]QWG05674.1 amidohydrolase [Flammeovirga kamogawensis]TRX67504.1 amidohydrolase [Flammeovirga kamogawensis]
MKSKYILLLFISIFIASCNSSTIEKADIIFTNGKIYTVNDDQPWAEAVGIKDNKIIFVGSSTDAKKYIGKATEVNNLHGKMMLPGFVSGHDHLISSNWMKAGVPLFEAKSKADYLRMIKDYADKNPNEPIVFGYGWNKDAYGGWPTAKDLDEAVPDRPAMIFDFTIHDMWFNTKGLAAGKISKNTKDPNPGLTYWRRDANGAPEGVAVELAWLDAFITAGAWNPSKMMKESQELLYDKAASCGLTSVINQGLITPNITNLKVYKEDMKWSFEYLDKLDKEGKLKLRTFQNYVYKNSKDDVDLLISEALALKEKYNSDRLRMHGIKVHPEGNWNSNTSLMLEPFLNTGTVGVSGVKENLLLEIHNKANDNGLDVHVHVDGSATTRFTINAIEASRKRGNTAARNVLQHYFWTHPEDHKRVVEMNIPVNTTPLFGTDWQGQAKDAYKFLGEERVNTYFMKYTSLSKDGSHNVSISADVPSSPVELLDPLFNLETAVTLQDPQNEKSQAFPPTEIPLDLITGIKALTIYPAWQARMEDKIGSIEVGKYADLVVLEDNIFEVGKRDLSKIKVHATMMDGKFTFKRQKGVSVNYNPKHEISIPSQIGCCEHGNHKH